MPLNNFKKLFSYFLMLSWLYILLFNENLIQKLGSSVAYWSVISNNYLTIPVIVSLIVSSFLLRYSKYTRITSLWILLNWIMFYQIFPFFFAPPCGAFMGWVLLWLILFPKEEKLDRPQLLLWWFILTLGFFCSGIGKLASSVWTSGEAVDALFNSALVRPYTEYINLSPQINRVLTYWVLAIELLGIALIFNKYTRKLLWLNLLGMNLFITIFLNIPEIGLFFLIYQSALVEE